MGEAAGLDGWVILGRSWQKRSTSIDYYHYAPETVSVILNVVSPGKPTGYFYSGGDRDPNS